MNSNSGMVEQDWGYELIWVNNNLYCSKLLVFTKPNSQTRLYFHKIKDKSWFINVGTFQLNFIDLTTGKLCQQVLNEGEVFNIPPSLPHQLQLIGTNGSISEVSTPEVDNDIFYLS